MENIIKIAEHVVTLKRNGYLRSDAYCAHQTITMEENGQTVKCDDCGAHLNPYWVLKDMILSIKKEQGNLDIERDRLNDLHLSSISLKAAKEAEKSWRSQSMVPSCPHCRRGILASDGFGQSKISKEIELQRRGFIQSRRCRDKSAHDAEE